MNNRKWAFWGVVVVMFFVLMSGGCGGGGSSNSGDNGGGSKILTVTPHNVKIEADLSLKLVAKGATGSVTWLPDDESVVTVQNDGSVEATLYAVAEGETDIVVLDDGGREAICHVKVTRGSKPEVSYQEIITEIPLMEEEYVRVTDVKLKDDVYTLLNNDSYLSNETLVVFLNNTAQASERSIFIGAEDLPVGSVLVVPPGGQIPSGTQGRIRSLSIEGGKVYILYDQISTGDIFDDLKLEWNLYFDERFLQDETNLPQISHSKKSMGKRAVTTPFLNITVKDFLTLATTIKLSGHYEEATKDYKMTVGMEAGVTVSLPGKNRDDGKSEYFTLNFPFPLGVIPMGIKFDIEVSAGIEIGDFNKLNATYKDEYTMHVRDGKADKPIHTSEFKSDAKFDEGVKGWEFLITPKAQVYLYVGVEDKTVNDGSGVAYYASGGIAGEVKNDFSFDNIKPDDIALYGTGVGVYSQFELAAKLLARAGGKIKLFKLIDIGKDLSVEYSLGKWPFNPSFLFKLWPLTEQLTIDPPTLSLKVGETYPTPLTVKYGDTVLNSADIKWSSSNNDITTVNGGIVTAHKVGTTTITASYTPTGGEALEEGCVVTVERSTFDVFQGVWQAKSGYLSDREVGNGTSPKGSLNITNVSISESTITEILNGNINFTNGLWTRFDNGEYIFNKASDSMLQWRGYLTVFHENENGSHTHLELTDMTLTLKDNDTLVFHSKNGFAEVEIVFARSK
ncbi:hypothetical protein AGMMS50276_24050 [Synergistales bacterium]|nr:hypothetical protein AGMMS50276_24050 [Synergistales bacterium]